MESNKAHDLNEFKTIDLFIEEHPQYTKTQIRWWLYERETNGFDSCVAKVGRRIYLHAPSIYDWFESQMGNSVSESL